MSTAPRFVFATGIALVAACTDPVSQTGSDLAESATASRAELDYVRLPIRGSAINNAGVVAGSVIVDGRTQAAVIDRSGTLTVLPGLGGDFSSAADINERGVVAGSAENANGVLRAVIWRDGVVHDLGTLGGETSWARGINNRGQVSGTSETADGDPSAFLWTDGRMVELGHLPFGSFSLGLGLNDRGDVVGWSGGGSINQDATLWKDGEIIDMGSLAFESAADAINNQGVAVGGSFPLRQTQASATVWDRGEIIDLGYLLYPCEPRFSIGCNWHSSANAINARGQIVGTYRYGPYLWDHGNVVQLYQEAGSSPRPVDINDAGTILGSNGELWGRIPPAMAKLDEATTATSSELELTPARPRPWAASYCKTRGRIRELVSDLDRAAGCPMGQG